MSPILTGSHLIDALTKRSEVFLFAYSPKGKVLVSWSENAEKILGVKDLAIARDGNLFLRHVHHDDRFLLLSDLELALKGGRPYRATYRWIRPDTNEIRWLHCRAAITKSADEEIFEGIIIDLSNEFTGQVARIAGPDSISTILAAFPTMVFTIDKDLRLLRLNRPRTMTNFHFGDSSFQFDNFKIGRPFLSCFKDSHQKQYYQVILNELLEGEKNYHRIRIAVEDVVYSLEVSPLLEHKTIEGLLFIVSDVSEIVTMERDLSNLQKQEGLRLLASGVSHNFNNSLQSIIGQAAVIRNHPTKTKLVQEASQAIIDIVNRASELSRQLFVNDHSSKDLLLPIDVNIATMSAMSNLSDFFSSGIKVSVAFGTPSAVLANQEKLSEALHEIFKNAKDSMPEGGILSIKTYQIYLNDGEVQGLKAGSYAKIIIADSGLGMSEETKARCLEPFYTTKDKDPETGVHLKGGGLGLTKAFTIVRDINGMITIDTQPQLGTTVSIFIPVHDSTEVSQSRKTLFSTTQQLHPAILIVDDDLMVLQTVKQILEDDQFQCVVAEDAKRALALMQRFRRDLQLVLVDAVMPGTDGATLLQRLKRINREIKAIGFSGAPDALTQHLRDAGAIDILKKPVDPELLKNAVKEALNSGQVAA